MTSTLIPKPLTRELFEPYGDVIVGTGPFMLINGGSAKRFDALATVDGIGNDARAIISIFRVKAQSFPLAIRMMERHPLGSQAFIPLRSHRFLVVVARAGEAPSPEDLDAFWSDGSQGVNYRAGVWHHPVLALFDEDEFLVVDRSGPGDNCEEVTFEQPNQRVLTW